MDVAHKSSRWHRVRALIEEVTPVLTVLMVLTVLFAAVYVIRGQSRVNRTMDCFATYTEDRATAEDPRVRAAARLDAQLIISDSDEVAWVEAVQDLINQTATGPAQFATANKALLASKRKVKAARINVQDARRANPYPAPCVVE